MSLIDTLKGLIGKGKEAAAQNADKIREGVDKAGGFIDEKTKGKFSDKIDKGAEAIKNAIPEQSDKATEAPATPESGVAPEPPTAATEPSPAPESAAEPKSPTPPEQQP